MARADWNIYESVVYATWALNTSYALGTIRAPSPANTCIYEVTTAGVSGAVQPVWPTTPGNTIVDNTVTWTCRKADYATTEQAYSPTHSLRGCFGPSGSYSPRFLYGGTTFTNSRIYFRAKQSAGAYSCQIMLILRFNQLNPIDNGYGFNFYMPPGAGTLCYVGGGVRWNGGVATAITPATWPFSVPDRTAWIRYRATCLSQSDYVTLTLEYWDTTLTQWIIALEANDNSASRIIAAGYTGFGFAVPGGATTNWIDDVQVAGMTSV